MATIEHVQRVDDEIALRVVLVSCTDKTGLVSDTDADGRKIAGLPENGLLGRLQELNPCIVFLSTGGTHKLLKHAGLNAKEVAEHTGYPEMETGLVKSLHPAIHAGILAHRHTASDDAFMREQGLAYIDALIVNFYPLDEMLANKEASFEMLRQAIDVGGPTMAHNARKAFISTALITEPERYPALLAELEKKKGSLTLKTRLALAKKASTHITRYLGSVDKLFQETAYEDLEKSYEIVTQQDGEDD